MKRLFNHDSRAEGRQNFTWREILEDLRVLKSVLTRLVLVLTDGLTKEWCIAVHLFIKQLSALYRSSGPLFLALYLKQCRVCLQRYIAKDCQKELSVSVSLTRTGMPRIIPSFHRKKIRGGDTSVIQFFLSLFSISKLITLAPKINGKLLDSVMTPYSIPDVADFIDSSVRPLTRALLERYIPDISLLPLFQGFRFMPTWKAVPTGRVFRDKVRREVAKSSSYFKELMRPSVFSCLWMEWEALASYARLGYSDPMVPFVFPTSLWMECVRFPFCHSNRALSYLGSDYGDKVINPHLISKRDTPLLLSERMGSLSYSLPGDGKRRVFAIGNYFKQRLLYPYHTFLMSVLRKLPMDGTFDQRAPLRRLKGSTGTIHSIDLKNATDRWPLCILSDLVEGLFGEQFSTCAVMQALGTNVFACPFGRFDPDSKPIYFSVGQPLGFYSSWPLFALSHHTMIWLAAEKVYPGAKFDRYAILGDDIVIADERVASEYRAILAILGVEVSAAKSLISPSGAVEFAKRIILDKVSRDVSPFSIRKVALTYSLSGWYHVCTTLDKPLRYSTLLRLGGLGHIAASLKPGHRRNKRRSNLYWCLFVHSHAKQYGLAVTLSVISKRWICPCILGQLWWYLYERFAPKDLIPVPEYNAIPEDYPPMEDTIYKEWVRQYLAYLSWYVCLLFKPGSLDDFLDAPSYTHTWYRPPERDLAYGLMFRMYDLVQDWSRKPILCLPVSSID